MILNALSFIKDGLVVLSVAVLPEVFEVLDSDCFISQFSAAFLEEHPLDLVVYCEEDFYEHDGGCVDPDGDEDDSLLGLPGHEEVDVEEDEGENGVVEEPVGYEGDFLNEISMDPLAVVALGPPRYVVDIAEGVDKHDVRIGALVDHVADGVDEQFKDETGVGGQVDQGNDQIAGDVDAGDNEDQCALGGAKDVAEAVDIVDFEVDSQDVVNDQAHEQEGVEGEDVADVVCTFGPLGSEETPGDAEDDHEDVDKREHLGCVLDDVAGTGLDDGGVEGEQVEGGDEVAVDETQQGQKHRY